MPASGAFTIRVKPSDEGLRLDVLVASRIPDCTRTYAANLIANEHVHVGGKLKKSGYRVKSGDEITGFIPPPVAIELKPEPIPIDILYEDEHIIVVNKQPGLVVHPAPGHFSGTLVNGLLHHCPDLGGIGGELRPGIVHRLDKDTSGTLVVAKNAAAHSSLSRQFKARKIQKQYLALVHGEVQSETGTVKLPIGRHLVDRKRMSTVSSRARTAETAWRVRERFKRFSLLELDLKTGRTHQIRVHCAAVNHPIVGDPVYRPRKFLKNIPKIYSEIPSTTVSLIKSVKRQMLHALQLRFSHPHSGEMLSFESPIPQDMEGLLNKLRVVT